MKVLVAYASAHGSTGEMAHFIGDILRDQQLEVTVQAVEEVTSIKAYDVFVFGSAIHSGLWLPSMSKFISRFRDNFEQKPIYFWLSCIRVLEEGGYDHAVEHYIRHDVLANFNVISVAAFAGKLNLQEVDWNERWTLAAHYDGTHTAKEFNGDFRDWRRIRRWAMEVSDSINPSSEASTR